MIFKKQKWECPNQVCVKTESFFLLSHLNCCRNTPCMRVWVRCVRKFPETESIRDPRARGKIKRRREREMEIVGNCRNATHSLAHYIRSEENLTLDVLQRAGEPVEALVQALAVGGARGLDVPVPVPHVLQAQLLRQLGRLQRVGQILWREHRVRRIYKDR